MSEEMASLQGEGEIGSVPDDLRSFLAAAEGLGEVHTVYGADWNLEMGALTEAAAELIPDPPLLLFDRIKDYPPGFRVASLPVASHRRIALAFGLPTDRDRLETSRLIAQRLAEAQAHPIKPQEVREGPVFENCLEGDSLDLLKFPVPRFHESDGGRYIGTSDSLICRDQASGFVNVGTYRQQVHERNLLGLWMSPGQQGRQICQSYWDRGQACPVAAIYGGDLATFFTSHTRLPWGVCEYDVAGGLRGRPLEVVRGPLTGLPIPARAEIAVEGEVPPPGEGAAAEGPFGEWPGYYSGGTHGTGQLQPVIRVKAIYHRNDPILLDMAPLWPGAPRHGVYFAGALLWEQLESIGIQDIAGVYMHNPFFIAVAIRQRYAGHAKQVAHAVLSCSSSAFLNRYVVIVDEDIDPSNMKEVEWAMQTRVDPGTDIEIVQDCRSTPLDPRMPPEKRASGRTTMSVALIYAVRPFGWKEKFPQVARSPRPLREAMVAKYRNELPFPRA